MLHTFPAVAPLFHLILPVDNYRLCIRTHRGSSISLGIWPRYCWRKAYGGLEIDQAMRMKDLERENVCLKRLIAALSLEKQVLKDVASGSL